MVDVMIFYTNNLANGNHTPYTRTEFQPSSSDITINCLFFASLSLSLVAALASIVALQWVGDYDNAVTRRSNSPEDRAKYRHFRHAGVMWWKMGEIIAALPVLLFSSVALFFAGLILWMLAVHQIVGIVVAGGAAVALLFYAISTFIGVVSVSAPFRTPITRGINLLYLFSFATIYRLAQLVRVPTIPSWLATQYTNYTNSNRRDEIEVESRSELGRDALIWLANQLSLSHGSARRFMLLVGELGGLKEDHMPSFDLTEAPWYSIFDLAAWAYMTAQGKNEAEEEKHIMEMFLRCYRNQEVRNIVQPAAHMNYTADTKRREYWYSGTVDEGTLYTSDGPNRLFLLLRDIPVVSESSPLEMEIASRLAHWRSLKYKVPQVWDDIFSRVELLPPESPFFSSCVVTFSQFCQLPSDVVWDDEHTEVYTATTRKVIQMATRQELPRDPTMLMVQAYESLLIGHRKRESTASVLTNPLFYGKIIEQRSAAELTTHESIILLLSRQLNSSPPTERIQRVEEVISLLWLRPSYPSIRNWNHLMAHSEQNIPLDPILITDWIKGADQIPHILEILQHLAMAQVNDTSIGPLWRGTVPNQYNDPHFLEALQTFDNLMGGNCTPDDHLKMIDWVCQDLEMAPSPDFNDYFNERRDYFAHLRDPCLQTLATCACGADVIRPVVNYGPYSDKSRSSWDRIEQHLLKMYPDSHSPVILQLRAKLWPMYSLQRNVYIEAMTDPATLVSSNCPIFGKITNEQQLYLQRLFQYPINCGRCLDGPGHLLFHLLDAAEPRKLGWELIPFIDAPLNGRTMEVAPIVFCWWYADADLPLPLKGLLGDGPCLGELEKMFNSIKSSEHQLLTFIWNVSTSFEDEDKYVFTEDLAAVLAGVRRALQLPPQPESINVLGALSLSISNLLERVQAEEYRASDERRMVSEAADITVNLLRSHVVHRAILGGRNNYILSCARATNSVQPAAGWLAPYVD
jgi:Family of unknown function (DUF6535)